VTAPVLLDDVTPLPDHVKWFAPWRWFAGMRPWKKWTMIVVTLLAWYIESPMVLQPFIDRFPHPMFMEFLMHFYAPLQICYEASPAVQTFYDTQSEARDAMLQSWGW